MDKLNLDNNDTKIIDKIKRHIFNIKIINYFENISFFNNIKDDKYITVNNFKKMHKFIKYLLNDMGKDDKKIQKITNFFKKFKIISIYSNSVNDFVKYNNNLSDSKSLSNSYVFIIKKIKTKKKYILKLFKPKYIKINELLFVIVDSIMKNNKIYSFNFIKSDFFNIKKKNSFFL